MRHSSVTSWVKRTPNLHRYAATLGIFHHVLHPVIGNPKTCMETSNFFRPWAWEVSFYQNQWAWNFGWLMMFLAEKHHHFGDELGSEMEIILVYKWWLVDNKPIIGIYPNDYPNYIPLMVSTNYFYTCSSGIPSQSWGLSQSRGGIPFSTNQFFRLHRVWTLRKALAVIGI